MRLALASPSWLSTLAVVAFADIITIDDQSGVFIYEPAEAWAVGQSCAKCASHPSPSASYNGTWMNASFNPSGHSTNDVPGQIISATVSFTGVAVYVQSILTGSIDTPNGNSDYTFYLDDVVVGVFQREPNGDDAFLFNQTVYSGTDLENSRHTLRIEVGLLSKKALILLDSVIYFTDDGDSGNSTVAASSSLPEVPVPSSSAFAENDSDGNQDKNTVNVGAIVGSIIGGVVLVSLGVFAFVFLRRRRRREQGVHASPKVSSTQEYLVAHPWEFRSTNEKSESNNKHSGTRMAKPKHGHRSSDCYADCKSNFTSDTRAATFFSQRTEEIPVPLPPLPVHVEHG